MNCRELVELVTAYFDDALSPEERAAFEYHLTECDGCVIYVEQMRRTVLTVERLTAGQMGRATRERLLSAFREWRGDQR